MLDISIQANTQQHLCSVHEISIPANAWGMEGLEQDSKLINDLAEWAGKRPSRIAAELGMAVTTLTRPANGKATTRLGRRTLEALQEAYPEFPGWSDEAPATRPVAVSDQLPSRSIDAGETVDIIRLDLSLPMGPGATVDDFVESEPIKFDVGYLRSFTRTPPHRLRLAGGAGDSMFPTLVPNDLVWIDTTQNQLLHADRIYAASINGGAAIKRLRPLAGGRRVLVISDNKLVDPYEVDAEEVVIWGRVIRFARDL